MKKKFYYLFCTWPVGQKNIIQVDSRKALKALMTTALDGNIPFAVEYKYK